MQDPASVIKVNCECSGEGGEVLRNQQKMRRPPPPPSLGTANLKQFQNGNLKGNSQNLLSFKGRRYIICVCFLKHSICRWSYTSSYWNLGSREENPGSWRPEKHRYQDTDLKLLTGIRLSDWKRIPMWFWVLDFLFGERWGGWLKYEEKYTVIFLGILG